MAKTINSEDVINILNELEKETINPDKKIFHQHVYLDKKTAIKLLLLAFLEKNNKSGLSRAAILQYIKEYEKENGNIISKAREKIN
ncbi:MAG: hypothetical protein CIT03_07840 [Methanobacterium sp.]|nr:MAG: hypothetical protein CIT03_07840 [Methanobacterium sp.]